MSVPRLDPFTFISITTTEFGTFKELRPFEQLIDNKVIDRMQQIRTQFKQRQLQNGDYTLYGQIGDALESVIQTLDEDSDLVKDLAKIANREAIFAKDNSLKVKTLLQLYSSGDGYKLLAGTTRKMGLGWPIISETIFHRNTFVDPTLVKVPVRMHLITEFRKIRNLFGLNDQQLPDPDIEDFVDRIVFTNTELAELKGTPQENRYTFGDMYDDFQHQSEKLSPSKAERPAEDT